ncbi:TPA: hypothetical protein ACT2EH_000185 [Streptococcus suis]
MAIIQWFIGHVCKANKIERKFGTFFLELTQRKSLILRAFLAFFYNFLTF